MWWNRRRQARELADAREEALRWYERLGGQVMNLPPGDEPATKQALVDAGERYNAAGGQLDRATIGHAVPAGPGDRAGRARVRAGGAGGAAARPGAAAAAVGRSARRRRDPAGARGERAGPQLPGGTAARRSDALLLPGWSGRWPAGPDRLVFRAVVEDRAGGRCLGHRRRARLRRAAWPRHSFGDYGYGVAATTRATTPVRTKAMTRARTRGTTKVMTRATTPVRMAAATTVVVMPAAGSTAAAAGSTAAASMAVAGSTVSEP